VSAKPHGLLYRFSLAALTGLSFCGRDSHLAKEGILALVFYETSVVKTDESCKPPSMGRDDQVALHPFLPGSAASRIRAGDPGAAWGFDPE
jgi:hypothetical protein